MQAQGGFIGAKVFFLLHRNYHGNDQTALDGSYPMTVSQPDAKGIRWFTGGLQRDQRITRQHHTHAKLQNTAKKVSHPLVINECHHRRK